MYDKLFVVCAMYDMLDMGRKALCYGPEGDMMCDGPEGRRG